LVNQVNSSHSERSVNGVKGYGNFHNDIDKDDKHANGARTDNARENITALKENIMGSREAAGSYRSNSITHDFNDFETTFL
jgi:hypothetical protein